MVVSSDLARYVHTGTGEIVVPLFTNFGIHGGSKKWFALARRKELGWGEQGSCIGNLTADVAAVVVMESKRR